MPRGRQASRATRLSKSWSNMLVNSSGSVLSTTQGVIGSVTISEGTIGEATVLRCRGNLLITCTPNAAADSDVVGLGLIVVTAAALAVGGTSIPGPLLDQGNDGWLWHQYVPFDAFGATTETEGNQLLSLAARVEIDAKGMRKLPQDWALVLMAELDSGEMASVRLFAGMRVLLGS